MISVPLQNNTGFGVGQYDRDQNVLNVQPVIPVRISQNWNLINRIIQPIVWQPNVQQPSQGWFGLGDMNPTFFLSPAKPHKLIWGVGPTFVIPTATADQLGQGKFSIGPAVVLLTTPGHWVIGTLINNVWSVAGSGSRPPVNQMLFQWFVNYNMKKGWYLVTSPINTADWRASSGNQWTVPLGWWRGTHHASRTAAGEYHGSVLWQRGAPGRAVPRGACECKFSSFIRRSEACRIVQARQRTWFWRMRKVEMRRTIVFALFMFASSWAQAQNPAAASLTKLTRLTNSSRQAQPPARLRAHRLSPRNWPIRSTTRQLPSLSFSFATFLFRVFPGLRAHSTPCRCNRSFPLGPFSPSPLCNW